jgi:hypothetical protein
VNAFLAHAFIEATTRSQRWQTGRVRYRPPGEVFDARRAEVVALPDRDARAFICAHHYSRSYPASRFRVGLLVKPAFGNAYLGGVAVYSVPMTQQVIPAVLPGVDAADGVELGRLVLLDTEDLKSNAESWFIARAHRLLKSCFPNLRGIVAYCDPLERRNQQGQLVKRSHTGVVYRATNSVYRGMSAARTLWLLPDGQVASERALSKLRTGDQGRDYAERMLREQGAPGRALTESSAAWLLRLKREEFLRPLRHPGNFRFAWRLDGVGMEAHP